MLHVDRDKRVQNDEGLRVESRMREELLGGAAEVGVDQHQPEEVDDHIVEPVFAQQQNQISGADVVIAQF